MLTKDSILQSNDLPTKKVKIPEWGGDAYIKTLTGAERLQLEKDINSDVKTNGPAMGRIVCLTLCDAEGKLLFSYPDDIAVVNTKSATVLQRLMDAALKANGLTQKDVDDLEKN